MCLCVACLVLLSTHSHCQHFFYINTFVDAPNFSLISTKTNQTCATEYCILIFTLFWNFHGTLFSLFVYRCLFQKWNKPLEYLFTNLLILGCCPYAIENSRKQSWVLYFFFHCGWLPLCHMDHTFGLALIQGLNITQRSVIVGMSWTT